MKVHFAITIAALALFAVTAASSQAAPQKQRTILFGVNYLPEVTCVEDFSPYWETDNWTEKRMITDLKIMKSIGCSVMRFHIMPSPLNVPKDSLIPAEKYERMIDLGVKTARELGLKVHLDLDIDLGPNNEAVIKHTMERYKGQIESYQMGNERWDFPQKPDTLKRLQQLVEYAHSVDPNARITSDIMVPDWVKIRDEHPDFYKELSVGTCHYYPVTDYHGWNQLYLDDLIDHLCNPTGRKTVESATYAAKSHLSDFGVYDAKAKSFDHDLYVGSWGWLDKEVWITEIACHGYWRWGNLTPQDKRAADWEKLVNAVAGSPNRVARIYHHCFRDKMSSREFGQGQSGIVYYDGSPRPATFAFRKMAVKYSPADSPIRDIACKIDRTTIPIDANTVQMKISLTNTSSSMLKGQALLELPDGITCEDATLRFAIPARKSETWAATLNVSQAHWGNNHAFVRINVPHGLMYGWGIVAKPKRVLIDAKASMVTPSAQNGSGSNSGLLPEGIESATIDEDNGSGGCYAGPVHYLQGFDAVQQFFDKYGDDCSIITGPCIGSDMEMAYRLKTVLQAERCREVELRPSILAAEVLNRPVIVIGTPVNNMISRAIEMTLPEDQRVSMTNPGAGKGLVNVVQAPFGQYKVEGRFSPQSEQLGYYFGSCPTALYIAGPDDAGTRAAVYDLILRIWGKDGKYR
jgi:hypothetical protein